MGRWVHRMISLDLSIEVGVCAACGPVEIAWKNRGGQRVPRCGVAVVQQRNTKNRHRGSHGLNDDEARAFKAGKVCAICGSLERLAVDHDHTTGAVRGALCSNCNVALGLFSDSVQRLESAIAYLRSHM